MTFSAFVPLGPNGADIGRARDLVESLLFYEPDLTDLVIVQDGQHDVDLTTLIRHPETCNLVVLKHPRHDERLNLFGGLCVANLVALDYIHRNSSVDFVLKLDTDSLVINRFSEKVGRCLAADPSIGTIGTLGDSCNRSDRSFRADHWLRKALRIALRAGLSRNFPSDAEAKFLRMWNTEWDLSQSILEERYWKICKMLEPLLEQQFVGSHCQGGAYGISRELMLRLEGRGLFRDPGLWECWTMGEDQTMGAFCTLTGLHAVDLSEPGQVFGVRARGLPYSPSELRNFGYSIVHSLKNDRSYSEEDIRVFFRCIRDATDRKPVGLAI